jgi:hypothetical protein
MTSQAVNATSAAAVATLHACLLSVTLTVTLLIHIGRSLLLLFKQVQMLLLPPHIKLDSVAS